MTLTHEQKVQSMIEELEGQVAAELSGVLPDAVPPEQVKRMVLQKFGLMAPRFTGSEKNVILQEGRKAA